MERIVFNETIGSEIHSVGFVNKNWSTYTVNAIFARLQNFQSSEIAITDPGADEPHYVANAVTIRKLPEVEFTSRDRRIWNQLPFWFSLRIVGRLAATAPSRCSTKTTRCCWIPSRPGSS